MDEQNQDKLAAIEQMLQSKQPGPPTIGPEQNGAEMAIRSFFDSINKQPILKLINALGLADTEQYGLTPEPDNGMKLGIAVPTGPNTFTKRIAPKRAATELVDLLLGRSSRVPRPKVFNEMPESEASLRAMLSLRHGGVPGPPTILQVPTESGIFKPFSKTLSRLPEVRQAFKDRSRLFKTDPNRAKTIGVGYLRDFDKQVAKPKVESATIFNKDVSKKIADKAGSLQDAATNLGLRPMTDAEMRNMLTAPVEAYKRGMLSKKEMEKVLAQNKAKIERYRRLLEQTVAEKNKNVKVK